MTRIVGRSIVAILVFLSSVDLRAQKDVTTVGFQLKPIIISDIVGSGPFEIQKSTLSVGVRPLTGMSFGMIIRTGITEKIAFETGINRVTRSYEYDFSDSETGYSRTLDFSYLNYEVPIKGLIFIQLGEDLYMNNSLGLSLDLYASDVASGDIELQQVTQRTQWAKAALEANLGMEFRSKKSGIFYLGTTFHNPFSRVARSAVHYRTLTEARFVDFDLTAGYLTLDFKYYFHEKPERN